MIPRTSLLEFSHILLFLQIANLFENNSSSEWLLYISEWTQGNLELSNLRVTTKVAVNALLGDTPALADYGSAIMHNLGTREVTAVVCIKYNQHSTCTFTITVVVGHGFTTLK